MAATGGYWRASDLAEMAPRPGGLSILASQSGLSPTTFQTMIAIVSAEFDSAAAKAGYLIPIPSTATTGYLFAQGVVEDGALAQAFGRIYTGPDSKFVDRYKLSFDVAIKAIGDGLLLIPGAPNDPGETGRLLVRSGGIPSSQITASMGYISDGGAFDF